jgi:CubicO group peptidase (beta-lactamase class C family)
VVPPDWVRRSISPHAAVDTATEYGYLWWLGRFGARGERAYYMSGNGGNRVMVFPDLAAVVVVTTTNYNRPDAHDLTDRLVGEYVLPSLR